MPPPVIVNPEALDLTKIIATKEEIEKVNPQRFEMQQLDAICVLNPDEHLVVGYKDVR